MKAIEPENSQFRVMIANDDDHEKVFAEIYFGDDFVALLSQEDGIEKMLVEIPGSEFSEQHLARKVDLDGFRRAL